MSEIAFQPSSGFMLVKPSETLSAEVLKVEEEDVRHTKGVVVAVGKASLHPSGKLLEAECNAGDTILFKAYGTEQVMGEDEHVIVPFENLRGVLNE